MASGASTCSPLLQRGVLKTLLLQACEEDLEQAASHRGLDYVRVGCGEHMVV